MLNFFKTLNNFAIRLTIKYSINSLEEFKLTNMIK